MTARGIYLRRGGAAAYLDGLATLMAGQGVALAHLALAPLGPSRRRAPVGPWDAYMAPYAEEHRFRAWRLGGRFYNGDPRAWLPGRPPADRGGWLPQPDAAAVAWAGRLLARLAPDVVVANYFNAAAVFAVAPPAALRAILTHDVMALLAPQLEARDAPRSVTPAMVAAEAAAFRAADLVLAIKDEDAAHIRAVAGDAVVATLPVTVTAPAVPLDGPRPAVALFVGTDFSANVDALTWLLAEIWPRVVAARPDARLRVVGSVAGRVAAPWPAGAERVGFVEDLGAEYAGAALAVVPVRFGSGVKIKLVESLAWGLPVVATALGAEGVTGAPPAALRIADDPQAFARAIVDALSDDGPSARAAARRHAETRHSAAVARNALRAALEQARARAGRREPASAAAG